MRWGPFEIFELDTGRFRLDGGAMFGVVPKVLWQKKHPADGDNRIELALRCLLVKGPGFCALIDSGMGQKWDSKSGALYALNSFGIEDLLAAQAGLSADEVTHVLITHLHFDHAGGLTRWSHDQKSFERVFPRAQILVSEENLRAAESPVSRERASYRSENWLAYKESGQLQTVALTPGESKEVLPGLWALRSDGHTAGQLIYFLVDASRRLTFCADLIPTASHLSQNYGMGFDLQPLLLMAEKERLLHEVAREGSEVFFEHDPYIRSAQIQQTLDRRGDKAYELLNPVHAQFVGAKQGA